MTDNRPLDTEANAPVLEIEGAGKNFGDVVALDDVSLTVDGGIVGLLGANGAGKSTLFRAVLDLVRLDQGSVRVHGVDPRRDGADASLAARRRIGYLPEDLHLYDRLTGRETLELVAGLRGVDDPDEPTRQLHAFGLDAKADARVGGYSLGQRKKLGLAVAFLGTPPLILLDEPLNGLDAVAMRDLRRRIESMADSGTTFLLSSHVMAFVERICPRVAILREGRLVADDSPDALRRRLGHDEAPFEDVFLALAVDP
ncbi:MAG: ABC transporter ATP-binding protein [Acidobacteriota bacterium]